MRCGAFDGILRMSGSISHWRVPMVPRYVTAAPGSCATSATAIVSLWTSMPTKSVRDCAMVDLRVLCDGAPSGSSGFLEAHPRYIGGQLTAVRKSLCLGCLPVAIVKECIVPQAILFDLDETLTDRMQSIV